LELFLNHGRRAEKNLFVRAAIVKDLGKGQSVRLAPYSRPDLDHPRLGTFAFGPPKLYVCPLPRYCLGLTGLPSIWPFFVSESPAKSSTISLFARPDVMPPLYELT